MKLKLIIICGLVAVIGAVFSFQMASNTQTKRDSYSKSAPQDVDEGRVSEAGVYVDAGLTSLRKNDSKAAEDAFRRALEIYPKYTPARAALATLYLAMGNQEKGEQELILATKFDPENEELLHIVGTYGSVTRRLDDYENFYRDFLKRKLDSTAAKKKLAEVLITMGELQRAWAYVHELWKARLGDTDVLYLSGRLQLAQNEYDRAAEAFSQVTRDRPRFAPAYYFLGQARLGTNDTRQAKIALTKAKELNPVWLAPRMALARIYLGSGAYDWALEESEPILQAQPRDFDILMIAGTARLKKGEAGPALDLFHRAKEINPADATPQINIGAAYVVQKKYGQALTAYEEALKLDPNRTDALGSIAQVLAVQGNQKAAFERVQQQLAKTQNKAEVYQLLGQLSVDQHDYEKALSYLEKAVALKPDLFFAAHLIASTYMAQKKFDQAIAESEKIIQKNPMAIPSYMLLGSLHDLKQQYDQANRYYKKVLDLDKNSALAANNLAWNYTQYGGDLDAALTLAQKARELNPNDEGIAHTLGWIYYKKGVYLKAINVLKESSEKLKDRNPTVLYHLGMAYSKKGDNTLAKESLSKALKLDQNFPEAKEAKQALDEIGAKTG
jgi:tetratricopeptide (TPR) repeat protein